MPYNKLKISKHKLHFSLLEEIVYSKLLSINFPKNYLPYPVVYSALSPFQLNKKQVKLILKKLDEKGRIEFIKFKGVRLK